MSTFGFRLAAPRRTFALDMSDEEREIMARHAEHWRPWVESRLVHDLPGSGGAVPSR
jgi:hypothetical protein